ncbi:hypothetical protein BZA05DRAFT_391307 [Tricharina praecox]|uniref:uncharacterized protein n=1 Tax=Tricharina praecox TaxID=43433 RepID=UPI00221FAF2C|nr:uncharacterized protein BZA05DRAFT_391307 [Tricharina praecox]KAI5855341.1 hypothetical protein BZA05DRAFT_391307 [Tricharina praecox]
MTGWDGDGDGDGDGQGWGSLGFYKYGFSFLFFLVLSCYFWMDFPLRLRSFLACFAFGVTLLYLSWSLVISYDCNVLSLSLEYVCLSMSVSLS